MIFKSKLLSQINNIEHGFFSKQLHTDKHFLAKFRSNEDIADHPQHIQQALEYFISAKQQFIAHQVHENNVYVIQEHDSPAIIKNKKVDALITNNSQQLLTIVTADCAPILLVEPHANIVAGIHSGWRSLFANIINNTINKMVELGGQKQYIICAIGPCIHQKHYEVGEEFYNNFITQDIHNEPFFISSNRENKFLFDLPACVRYNLHKQGILDKNIEQIPLDTYEMEDVFFSYRRYTKEKEDYSGLQMSCIMLK